MAGLTLHVLDLMNGVPGGGMRIDLARVDGGERRAMQTLFTNAEGRTDEPVMSAVEMSLGCFELVFHVRDYFSRNGANATFFDRVPVRFKIESLKVHYHVPLLVSPWGYQSYMGT
ncbi:hypothetical protein ASC75_24705 [Aminobacter sp. DSM 101952]|uniref:hydroxyisourate hydrolase n=1 Tax=Aminobacter sp. DSM 101952 TaxID=2735891 RepID=UPI0006F47079|nr:hydroxyisourate hydrolase [Aminobacter sp. DSM 101952]KQU71089.1 hypothetical protein ASC75_24705 [Aminobacter sp. DSM 101952]